MTRVEDEVITHFYYTGSALLFTTVNEYVLQTQNILDPSGTIVASKRFEGQAATGAGPVRGRLLLLPVRPPRQRHERSWTGKARS